MRDEKHNRWTKVKVPRWKYPELVPVKIEKDIRPSLGAMPVGDVKPRHVQDMLNAIVDRGAPTTANDVLRWTRNIFDYGINQEKSPGLIRNPLPR